MSIIDFSHICCQGPDFEAKVAKLVELGFGREAVIQALKLFDGNEEQAAGFLFGG
jgi:DNA damage-inducible protein 1